MAPTICHPLSLSTAYQRMNEFYVSLRRPRSSNHRKADLAIAHRNSQIPISAIACNLARVFDLRGSSTSRWWHMPGPSRLSSRQFISYSNLSVTILSSANNPQPRYPHFSRNIPYATWCFGRGLLSSQNGPGRLSDQRRWTRVPHVWWVVHLFGAYFSNDLMMTWDSSSTVLTLSGYSQ